MVSVPAGEGGQVINAAPLVPATLKNVLFPANQTENWEAKTPFFSRDLRIVKKSPTAMTSHTRPRRSR